MNKHFITIMLAMTTIAAAAQPQQFGYMNPVIPGFNPDPSVCRVGEDYYLVTSTFQYFPGVPVYHSKDLIHWEQIGNCLTRKSQLDLKNANCSGGIYAPTIRYHEGTFYMVTTNVSGKGNFFVTTKDPAGEWSDPIWLEQGGIDPTLYFEGDKTYMVSNPRNGIYLCEIDINTGKQLTESRLLWQGDGGRYPEAPHIYKKDGWYYLMIAEGGTEYGHSITIARSRDIYGPYESNPDNPILTNFCRLAQTKEIQGTGHGDIIEDQNGLWWIVFLGFRPQNGSHHLLGRETFLETVDWTDEGWPMVNDGTADMQKMVATLPQVEMPKPPVNRLSTGRFDPWYIHLNTPVEGNYLFVNDSTLRLKPTNVTLDEAASPTFIAIRQDKHDFRLDSEVDLSSATLGDIAGLSVYMENNAHADIYLRQDKSKKKQSIVIEYTLYGLKNKACEVEVDKGPAVLRVDGTKTEYVFYYRDAKGKWVEAGRLDTRLLSTETAGGFTGITLGMFAVSKKGGGFSYADFKSFSYR